MWRQFKEVEAVNMVEAVREKVFKESDEHGEKVVAVKGGVVAKLTVPSMKLETEKAKSLRETHVTGVRVDDRVLLFCVRLVSYD